MRDPDSTDQQGSTFPSRPCRQKPQIGEPPFMLVIVHFMVRDKAASCPSCEGVVIVRKPSNFPSDDPFDLSLNTH